MRLAVIACFCIIAMIGVSSVEGACFNQDTQKSCADDGKVCCWDKTIKTGDCEATATACTEKQPTGNFVVRKRRKVHKKA